MFKGLVSVVILANERPELLRYALESALRQDYPDIEIIIVQDSENNMVRDVATGYSQNSDRVKYIKNPRPGNIAEASNYGVSVATGEYIAILDDDDEWCTPTKISEQVRFLENAPDHVAVGGGVIVINGNGIEVVRYKKRRMDSEIRAGALQANPLANSATIFRRSAWEKVGKYDEGICNFHDWEFWLKMGGVGKLANLDEYVLKYRLWDGGSSWVKIRDNARASRVIVNRYRQIYPGYLQAILLSYCYTAYSMLPGPMKRASYTFLSSFKKNYFQSEKKFDETPSIRSCRHVWPTGAPTVSVVIPVRNEMEHIGGVIDTVLLSKYRNILEILIVDGRSDDGTREIVEGYSHKDPRIKIVDNARMTVSDGLNLAFEEAKGEFFLRLDAHAEYSPNYIEACVDVALRTGSDSVGGAQRFVATERFQFFVAIASKTAFGSGGAKYRRLEYEGFVDTVFLGCFKYSSLERVKLGSQSFSGIEPRGGKAQVFSSINVTNQDAELNARIRRFGSIYQSRDIIAYYFPRQSFDDLCRQYFRYGRGRMLTTLLHRQLFARGNVPFLVLWTATTIIGTCAIFGYNVISAMTIVALVLAIIVDSSIAVIRTYRNGENATWRGRTPPPSGFSRGISVPIIVLTINVFHGLGFCYQVWRVLIRRKVEW